jgi:hypothetical protein
MIQNGPEKWKDNIATPSNLKKIIKAWDTATQEFIPPKDYLTASRHLPHNERYIPNLHSFLTDPSHAKNLLREYVDCNYKTIREKREEYERHQRNAERYNAYKKERSKSDDWNWDSLFPSEDVRESVSKCPPAPAKPLPKTIDVEGIEQCKALYKQIWSPRINSDVDMIINARLYELQEVGCPPKVFYSILEQCKNSAPWKKDMTRAPRFETIADYVKAVFTNTPTTPAPAEQHQIVLEIARSAMDNHKDIQRETTLVATPEKILKV